MVEDQLEVVRNGILNLSSTHCELMLDEALKHIFRLAEIDPRLSTVRKSNRDHFLMPSYATFRGFCVIWVLYKLMVSVTHVPTFL